MSIEERLNNLEKGYKELCQSHDKNKQAHLLTASSINEVNNSFKEIRNLIKTQQIINNGILSKLQELEDRK
jgi:hypothetical protein|tara:strand:- start:4825 stop:5037 length:213 start_codon:yes stop_codon:yes gene_type:complete